MTARVRLGYFIRRTRRSKPPDGKTLCAHLHKLYPTHDDAVGALRDLGEYDMLDPRFEYDVAEAWADVAEAWADVGGDK